MWSQINLSHLPVVISDQTIKQVGSYKYLGIHIDSKLSWSVHFEAVCSRAQKRLCFLWRLGALGVSTNLLLLFYRATTESLIRYGITSVYGNQSVQSKSQFLHITSTSSKTVGCTLCLTPGNLRTDPRATSTNDLRWLLHVSFTHNTKCSPRLNVTQLIPECKLSRHKYSFIPLSIKDWNQHMQSVF